jgi:DNA polymerase-4
MALRLSGRDQNLQNAIELAQEIKQSIYKIGSELHCSIGISSNRFLSKIASDMKKPNGLTVLPKSELISKLEALKLRDIPGIGARMEERLRRFGIQHMHQLLKLDIYSMREIWGGIWGERMYKWLRGEDFDVQNGKHKSFSHQHVLPPNLRNFKDAYAVAQKLLLKGAVRLRKYHLWASRMYVSVRYVDRTKWSEEIKMLECQDSLTLLEALQMVWRKAPIRSAPLKVCVALMDLIDDKERTFSLFENTKRLRLSQAVDSLNLKYGRNTVYFGGVHEIKAAAPTRIAFSSIPDFTI